MALVVAVGLAGCASGGTRVGPGNGGAIDSGPTSNSPMGTGGVSCTASDPFNPDPSPSGPAPAPLAASFVPVEATRCVLKYETVPGDGEWLVRVEQRAGGDLSALATELRRPSDSPAAGLACPAIAFVPIIITLVDPSGATVVPAIPHEACGGPQRGAVQAIEALSWQTVKETRIRQTRSELELESGCAGAYKPVVALAAADGGGRQGPTGPVFTPAPSVLQVCRYEIDRTQTSVNINGIDFGTGVLRSATTLDGAALTRLLTALDQAPPADRACAEPQAPFAILYPKGEGGRYLGVELSGCHRFADDNGGLRQLDAATVALLTA